MAETAVKFPSYESCGTARRRVRHYGSHRSVSLPAIPSRLGDQLIAFLQHHWVRVPRQFADDISQSCDELPSPAGTLQLVTAQIAQPLGLAHAWQRQSELDFVRCPFLCPYLPASCGQFKHPMITIQCGFSEACMKRTELFQAEFN